MFHIVKHIRNLWSAANPLGYTVFRYIYKSGIGFVFLENFKLGDVW